LNYLKYLFGAIISIPLLPILAIQGKRVRASVPELGEAIEPKGKVEQGSDDAINLLCIGESTMASVGAKTHKEGLGGSIAKELAQLLETNVNWEVIARNGYTAKRVHEKLLRKTEGKEADLIVIGLGGNDAFTLNTPWKWEQAITGLITKLQDQFPATPIFFLNMPPIKEFPAFTPLIRFVIGNLVEILGNSLTKITNKNHLVYYSSEIITTSKWTKKWNVQGSMSDFFSDGVHPSKLTYQIWAKDMAHFINKHLAINKLSSY